jgi:hypothetical protein
MTMRRKAMKTIYFALAMSLTGCGGTDDPAAGPEVLPALTVPAPPANGVQVLTPIFEDIQPGTDYEVCAWTDQIFESETDVRSTLAYQTEPPGHHVVLFYTLDKQPAGTQRECTDTDMASFRYLTGNGTNGMVNEAPGDLVFRIPAGAQLVVNSHYLNAGDDVERGQGVINVNYADPGNYTPTSSTAILNSDLEVQQGITTQRMHCSIQNELDLWYLIPHMHRWGKEIKVDITRSGVKERMFETVWSESFTFHPPEKRYDPAAPFTLKPGDSVDVECTWNNTESRTLPFGFEMCVVFGQYKDSRGLGNLACDDGYWTSF